jgi:hypothetical protein
MKRVILILFVISTVFTNISISQELVFVGSYIPSSPITDVYVEGTSAYLGGFDGLYIVDIFDPANPQFVGEFNTPDMVSDVKISGNYAFLTSHWHGLYIIDISSPQCPLLAGFYSMGGYIYNLFITGNYAYVCDQFQNFEIVDISDPVYPVYSGYYLTGGAAFDAFLLDTFACVANGLSGLQIINIVDPENPTLVSNHFIYDATGIYVKDSLAYLSLNEYGFGIINIADPTNTQLITTYSTLANAYDVAVLGNYAFLVEEYYGIEVVEISDPFSPATVDTFSTLGWNSEITVDGSYIYVADGSSLQILQFDQQLGLDEDEIGKPVLVSFLRAYPNPFNARTTIEFALAEPGDVELVIYDITGAKVETIRRSGLEAGRHTIAWDARDAASGVYFARIDAGGESKSIKMVLLK